MAKNLGIAGWLVMAIPAVLTFVFSTWPTYSFTADHVAAFTVAIKHSTARVHLCDEAERAAFKDAMKGRVKHMQRKNAVCGSREKAVMGLKITIDDKVLFSGEIKPSGLHNDGVTYVYESFHLPSGPHKIKVEMRDTNRSDGEFDHTFERDALEFAPSQVIVLDFDSGSESFVIL